MHRHNHFWRELNLRPLAHHQCSPLSNKNSGFVYFCWRLEIRKWKVVESGSAYGAFASERALRRIKVGRYLLTFQSPNLVHLRRKLMNKLCQNFFIKASTFLSNSSHYSSNFLWARRTKYSLGHNCPEQFNGPKIVHFRWKPERMNVAKSMKSWSSFPLVHHFFGVAFLRNSFEALCQSSKLLIAIIVKTKFVNFCQKSMKNLFFYTFFWKNISISSCDFEKSWFLYMFFCTIRLWKQLRHGLKIVYKLHKT